MISKTSSLLYDTQTSKSHRTAFVQKESLFSLF